MWESLLQRLQVLLWDLQGLPNDTRRKENCQDGLSQLAGLSGTLLKGAGEPLAKTASVIRQTLQVPKEDLQSLQEESLQEDCVP